MHLCRRVHGFTRPTARLDAAPAGEFVPPLESNEKSFALKAAARLPRKRLSSTRVRPVARSPVTSVTRLTPGVAAFWGWSRQDSNL